jgi:hypothetical protein
MMVMTAMYPPPLGGSEAVKKEKDCGDHYFLSIAPRWFQYCKNCYKRGRKMTHKKRWILGRWA